MYSELIYTRCGEGIDILRGKTPIKNSGFKVFSCSDNVTEEGFVDLPLLYTTAQSKESYSDPSFMDDAYLYVTPDIGKKLLLNFHPVPFDKTATGDFSHRPGNFINQIFIGDYEEFYPFETFGNESVWDAQKRGEAYYYENSPTSLSQRDNLDDSTGNIGIDAVSSFINDGRREVLTKAIAFIIMQFSLPAEERKFLVIKDENSQNIEMWIAAIESAFSPRMASGISFASRLDKFVNSNKYTVNLNGQYQTQINLQSPNQKLRYRAMIVGVDERDKVNIASARALANSPFVVLDGKIKDLPIDVDVTDPYYQHVTTFGEEHFYFCREFLQSIDIKQPVKDITQLFVAYKSITKYGTGKRLQDLVKGLSIINRYEMVHTRYLEGLYNSIKGNLSSYISEDVLSAFSVLDWLEKTSLVVGDTLAKDVFESTICKSYADALFNNPNENKTEELQKIINSSAFAQNVANYIAAQETIVSYENAYKKYRSSDWKALFILIKNHFKYYKPSLPNTIVALFIICIRNLYQNRDGQCAVDVASSLSEFNLIEIRTALMNEAEANSDYNYQDFLIQLIARVSSDLTVSENNLASFYSQLKAKTLENHFDSVLAFKARSIARPQEMERFLDWIISKPTFRTLDLSKVFKALDKNVKPDDKSANGISFKIQKNKPDAVKCINSAHVYALFILDDKRMTNNIVPAFQSIFEQGFPEVKEESYVQSFAEKLISCNLPYDSFEFVVVGVSKVPLYCEKLVQSSIRFIGSRQEQLVGNLISVASSINSRYIFDSFVDELSELKQFDKNVVSISSTIRTKEAQQYFARIEKEARIRYDQRKGSSIFGRLFSRGSDNKTGKK